MSDPSKDDPQLVSSEDIPDEGRTRGIEEAEAAIAAIRDEENDLSDIPEKTDWSNAVRGLFSDSPQAEIRLRIDRDVIRWILRRHGEYQDAINAVLREHMERHRPGS